LTIKETIKKWNSIAETYDEWFCKGSGVWIFEHEKALLKQTMVTCKKTEVLEVGCGSGLFTSFLLNEGFEVFGLDFSVGMVKKAKDKDVEVVVGDAHHLPFKAKTFNVVLLVTTLEFLKEEPILDEICRVLRVGGYLVLAVHNKFNPWNFYRKFRAFFKKGSVYKMIKYYSFSSLKKILRKKSFSVSYVDSCVFLPFSPKLDFLMKRVGLKCLGSILFVRAELQS